MLVVGGIVVAEQETKKSNVKDKRDAATQPALRDELLARVKIDQEIRFKLIQWAQENKIDLSAKEEVLKLKSPVITEMVRIDQENRQWLKGVIEEHGWPGKSMVRTDGAHAAWLLVQHADDDRPFQKRCLALMQAANEGEVAGMDIGYLVDRVRVGEGKKQLYGTQVQQVDGRWVVRNVEDPEHLNQRRATLGMPSIEEYLKLVQQVYSQQAKPDPPKPDSQEPDSQEPDN